MAKGDSTLSGQNRSNCGGIKAAFFGVQENAPSKGPMAVSADQLDAVMQAAQAGDSQAFAEVVRSVEHSLRGMLLAATADPSLADDIAADALVMAWERRAQYRPGTSPRAWILAIARSRLIDHQRRQDRHARHLPDLIRAQLLRQKNHLNDEDQLAEERRKFLSQCVANLDASSRELLHLVYGQNLDSAGAGLALGLRPDACRQRLCRLHRMLRSCVTKNVESASEP